MTGESRFAGLPRRRSRHGSTAPRGSDAVQAPRGWPKSWETVELFEEIGEGERRRTKDIDLSGTGWRQPLPKKNQLGLSAFARQGKRRSQRDSARPPPRAEAIPLHRRIASAPPPGAKLETSRSILACLRAGVKRRGRRAASIEPARPYVLSGSASILSSESHRLLEGCPSRRAYGPPRLGRAAPRTRAALPDARRAPGRAHRSPMGDVRIAFAYLSMTLISVVLFIIFVGAAPASSILCAAAATRFFRLPLLGSGRDGGLRTSRAPVDRRASPGRGLRRRRVSRPPRLPDAGPGLRRRRVVSAPARFRTGRGRRVSDAGPRPVEPASLWTRAMRRRRVPDARVRRRSVSGRAARPPRHRRLRTRTEDRSSAASLRRVSGRGPRPRACRATVPARARAATPFPPQAYSSGVASGPRRRRLGQRSTRRRRRASSQNRPRLARGITARRPRRPSARRRSSAATRRNERPATPRRLCWRAKSRKRSKLCGE